MAGRVRRRSSVAELEPEDGPFVSFTDLTIGILFLFLILVAALVLMQQEAVQNEQTETQAHAAKLRRISADAQDAKARLAAIARLDAEHPPFRLAIVFNSYQRPAGTGADWTYSRTVQVYRTPNGLCLNNVIMRNNLSLAWKQPAKPENIPTREDEGYVRMGMPCTLSASGERWNTDSETGGVKRISADLYSGVSVLHKKDGDERLEIQYRVLGVYDDYFR